VEIRITEDELAGIYQTKTGEYAVNLARVPLAVQSLRDLADKLERIYAKNAPPV
jgi:hypothetical protein